MRRENQRIMSKFLLLGLPIQPEQQGMSFALFLGMYLTTVLGNLLITLLIRLDPCLHTCMYFFLSHMDLMDISFSLVAVPKMLMNRQTQDQSIPYAGCVTQIYFFAYIENLLAVIAYYRYVDIGHPRCYGIIMRKELCLCFLAKSWLLSCASTLTHTFLLAQLSFCTHSIIPHFCDLATLLNLSFSDTSLNDLVIFTEGAAVLIYLLSFILISYGCIGVAIMRVSSTKGICKTLSSYGSHLSVVSLFYGTMMPVYFSSSSGQSHDKDIIASMMYIVVTPMLKPFIYSLRNRDMTLALGIFFRNNNHFAKENNLTNILISLTDLVTKALKYFKLNNNISSTF